MDGKPRGGALRRGRYSEPGRVYLVTTVTRNRLPLFRDFAAARMLVGVLKREQDLGRAQTLAYVVMPDHLHWMMALSARQSLSTVVRAVKAVTAHEMGRPVWQAGFHDHAVRKEEDMAGIARYVVANPVRARLVKRVGDYPHWDAAWL